MKIILLGLSYPYRGGVATHSERLTEEFFKEGEQIEVITFKMLYPAFLFPGKSQYSETLKNHSFKISKCINSLNFFNWIAVARKLKRQKPDLILVPYWLPFFAPCLSIILWIARRNKLIKTIAICHNIIPHEKRFFDTAFTRFFVRNVDAFVVMSKKVQTDLEIFDSQKPRMLTPHPLFDNFGESVSRKQALTFLFEQNKSIPRAEETIRLLFFGLIREYKGLDLLIRALASEDLRHYPLHLVVAGEFYEYPNRYYDMIKSLNIGNKVSFVAKFIDDKDVKNYFCSSDLLVLPYKDATQSGVTQISYHFNLPMLVTNVGGLPEIVPDGKCGYVCEPTEEGIAGGLLKYCQTKPDFSQSLLDEKRKYEWNIMTQKIKKLYSEC